MGGPRGHQNSSAAEPSSSSIDFSVQTATESRENSSSSIDFFVQTATESAEKSSSSIDFFVQTPTDFGSVLAAVSVGLCLGSGVTVASLCFRYHLERKHWL